MSEFNIDELLYDPEEVKKVAKTTALFKDVRFSHVIENDQFIVNIKVREDLFPIVKMVSGRDKDMWNRGLQLHHKDLVNMQELTQSLKVLLSSLASTDRFEEAEFKAVIAVHKKYISTHLMFDALVDRVRMAQSIEGWA
jgi:hypothetical protein